MQGVAGEGKEQKRDRNGVDGVLGQPSQLPTVLMPKCLHSVVPAQQRLSWEWRKLNS